MVQDPAGTPCRAASTRAMPPDSMPPVVGQLVVEGHFELDARRGDCRTRLDRTCRLQRNGQPQLGRSRDLLETASGLRVRVLTSPGITGYIRACRVVPVRARQPRAGCGRCRLLTGSTTASEQTTSKHASG